MTQDFWGKDKSRQEMQFKTVVLRVTSRIPLDPARVNAPSYAYVQAQDGEAIEAQVAAEANGKVIDVETVEAEQSPAETETAPADEQDPEPVDEAPQPAPAAEQAPQQSGPLF